MLDKKNRDTLQAFQSVLLQWESALPERAKGFHRLCQRLQEGIARDLSDWHIDGTTVDMRRSSYDQLEQLFRKLLALINKATLLEVELNKVQMLFDKEKSASSYASKFHNQQMKLVEGIWSCEKLSQLEVSKKNLDEADSCIHLHNEALAIFQDADELISLINSDVETAALKAELQEQRILMVKGELNKEGVNRIKALCGPIKILLHQPAPEQLTGLAGKQKEIRQWNKILALPDTEERDLELRVRQQKDYRARQNSPELERLVHDANMLLQERKAMAAEWRYCEVKKQAEALDELIAVCGSDSEIDIIKRNLNALSNSQSDNANEHTEWVEKFDEEKNKLEGLVSHYTQELEKRLQKYCTEAETILQTLLAKTPLTKALNERAKQLQITIDNLGRQGLLNACQQAKALPDEAQNIADQAVLDAEELSKAKQQLLEDYEKLQQQAGSVGFGLEDIQPAIEALHRSSAHELESVDLDEAGARAMQLRQQLEKNRQDFNLYCQNKLHQIAAEFNDLQAALDQANAVLGKQRGDDAEQINAIFNSNTPYSEQFAKLDALRPGLNEKAQAVLNELNLVLARQQQHLQLRYSGPLHPDQSEEIDELLAQLNALFDHETTLSNSVETRVELLNNIGQYWGYQQAEELKRKDRLQACKIRLKALKSMALKNYYPKEQANRLTDLVYGLPLQPKPIHSHQLMEIERLLSFFEHLVQRKIAEQTVNQVLTLEDGKHRHSDKNAVIALLASVQQQGHTEPLSEVLRKQLESAAAAIRSPL